MSHTVAAVFRACPEKEYKLDVAPADLMTFLGIVNADEDVITEIVEKPGMVVTLLETAKYLMASETWCDRFDRADLIVLDIGKDRGHVVLDLISDLSLDKDIGDKIWSSNEGNWYHLTRNAWDDAFAHGRIDGIQRYVDSCGHRWTRWTQWSTHSLTQFDVLDVYKLLDISRFKHLNDQYHTNILREPETLKSGGHMNVVATMALRTTNIGFWRTMLLVPNYTEWFEAFRTAWPSDDRRNMYTRMFNACVNITEKENFLECMADHLGNDKIPVKMIEYSLCRVKSGMKVMKYIDARVIIRLRDAVKYKKWIAHYKTVITANDDISYVDGVHQKLVRLVKTLT
jgi:hypothetical protein